eukprot:554250-Pyramimonas_sp.AAC.2
MASNPRILIPSRHLVLASPKKAGSENSCHTNSVNPDSASTPPPRGSGEDRLRERAGAGGSEHHHEPGAGHLPGVGALSGGAALRKGEGPRSGRAHGGAAVASAPADAI